MDDIRATDWRLVWLLWAAGLGAAAQYGKMSIIFDRLDEVYPHAGAGLGFAVSLVGSLGIVFGIVAGVLVARIGFRRALLSALCLGALMSAVQAIFPPLPVFLASRIAEGAAHLAIVVAAPTLIAQITLPKDRGFALTLWGTFFGVAFAVLAFAGLPLVAAYGMGSLMVAHGLYMAGVAVLLWLLLPRGLVPQAAVPLAELWRAHGRIYQSPQIGAPALGWLFYTFCFVSVLTVLPPFVAPEWRAFTIGSMPLMSIFVSMTFGVALLRRMSAIRVVMLGFAICAVCAALLGVFPGQPALALALGGGLGLVQGATFAAVPQLNELPEDRALANGGMAQMGNLGNTLGTPAMVAVIASFGYGGMVVLLFAMFLGGGLVHSWCARRRSHR